MDLTFVQTSNMFGRDGAWETEFSVDQEFNLHLERESSGKIIMMQKTAGTFFDIVKDFDMKSGDVVYDYDSASFLGTKTIKIVSESAIRFASLTTSGEVTEIKSQSKEIEVTSNGTTEITPDAGFAYLNSVKVKTNVAGSGGGSAMEYWDVSSVPSTAKEIICTKSVYVKGASEMGMSVAGSAYANFDDLTNEKPYTLITAVAIDLSAKIVMGMGDIIQTISYREFLINNGVSADQIASIPRITEAEFYNLNA